VGKGKGAEKEKVRKRARQETSSSEDDDGGHARGAPETSGGAGSGQRGAAAPGRAASAPASRARPSAHDAAASAADFENAGGRLSGMPPVDPADASATRGDDAGRGVGAAPETAAAVQPLADGDASPPHSAQRLHVGESDAEVASDDSLAVAGAVEVETTLPAPLELDGDADDAAAKRLHCKKVQKTEEREALRARQEEDARRASSIKDPAIFAKMIVWREGRWSKKQQQWVVQNEYQNLDPDLSAERHHDRADSALMFWTMTDADREGRRSECTQMHSLTISMAVAIMGEGHIHTHKSKHTDDRSQWWLCVVAAACDLGLFGEVTLLICANFMLT